MADAKAGDAAVAHNLANADELEGSPHTGGEALTTAAGGVGETNHPDPAFMGIDATIWVSLAMLVFLVIVVWKGGVRAVTTGLDRQIADIRKQLDDARSLRAEAETLRDEYAAKIAAAEGDAQAMLAHAESEATALLAKAATDADDLVARRGQMAEDKLAAAERAAIAEVRATAANAAAKAAGALIAAKLGATGDKPLVDRTIAGLGRPN
ncbi:MAG: F0F1 ATP synthase subunit B [Pseudomonadota bacterium]